MVHGSTRIGCVYLAGVLAGSLGKQLFAFITFSFDNKLNFTTHPFAVAIDVLSSSLLLFFLLYLIGTSVFDPEVYLVGASGGVYALLAAHLANVMLNYRNMQYGILRLLAIFLFGKYFN